MNDNLISRSALLKEVTRCFDAFIHGAYFSAACDAIRAKRAVIRMLNDAPAVDAEAVRHGRWVGIEYDGYADGYPVYDLWECSECRDEHKGDEDTLTPYCPNCGAKMDGDANAD